MSAGQAPECGESFCVAVFQIEQLCAGFEKIVCFLNICDEIDLSSGECLFQERGVVGIFHRLAHRRYLAVCGRGGFVRCPHLGFEPAVDGFLVKSRCRGRRVRSLFTSAP